MDERVSLDEEVRSIRGEVVSLMVRICGVRNSAIAAEVDTIESWWNEALLIPLYRVRSRLEELVDRDYDLTNIYLDESLHGALNIGIGTISTEEDR